MKVSLLTGSAVFLQCVCGIAILPRQNVPGVVIAPTWRRNDVRSVVDDQIRERRLLRRATSDTVIQELDNAVNKLLYFANSSSLTDCVNDSYHRNARTKIGVADRYWVK